MSTVGIILCIILIPLLIANTTLVVRSFVYPDKVPSFLGYKPFIVLSNSMKPEINSGDIALVREVAVDSLKQGDIIAFKERDSVITHRIVKITEVDGARQFITRGDDNTADDAAAVKEEMVEGLYLLHIPKLGNGALFMQSPTGMILFVALPLILFILYDILRRRLYDRKKQKKTMELEKELERMRQQILSTESKEDPEKQTKAETAQSLK